MKYGTMTKEKNEMKIETFGYTVAVKMIEDEKNANEQRRKWYHIRGQYKGFNFSDDVPSGLEYAMCVDGQITDFNGIPLDECHEKNMVRELVEKFEG